MMRRVGPAEDKGPMFFLVYEISWHAGSILPTGVNTWGSLAFWSMGAANDRAAKIKANGYMAFVEAR